MRKKSWKWNVRKDALRDALKGALRDVLKGALKVNPDWVP
jgi:hypothetical protein